MCGESKGVELEPIEEQDTTIGGQSMKLKGKVVWERANPVKRGKK